MANTNTPFGLQVLRGGGVYSFSDQGNLYSIPTSDSTNAYYLNDAVKAAASGSAEGIPNVTKAATLDPLRGSIQAIYPVYAKASLVGTALALETTYIPATKAAPYFVLVDDDPSTIYMVQDDGITTANLVAASCNLNSPLTITNGATTTSPSGTVLLSASFATGATAGNMKLLGLVQGPIPGGNTFAAYAKWQCRINLGEFAQSGFAGV